MSSTDNNITYRELCQTVGIEGDLLVAIVEYGIVTPKQHTPTEEWVFEANSVYWIKKASRLRLDLEIDWIAVAMVIDLMKQKDNLKKENLRINRLLERFIEGD